MALDDITKLDIIRLKFSLASRVVTNVDDLIQDTFEKAHRIILEGKYEERGSLYGWLYRMAINMDIDHIRRKSLNVVAIDDRVMSLPDADNHEPRYNMSELEALIEELPPKQERVIRLRYITGLKFKEISDITGDTVSSAIGANRNGLNSLKKKLIK